MLLFLILQTNWDASKFFIIFILPKGYSLICVLASDTEFFFLFVYESCYSAFLLKKKKAALVTKFLSGFFPFWTWRMLLSCLLACIKIELNVFFFSSSSLAVVTLKAFLASKHFKATLYIGCELDFQRRFLLFCLPLLNAPVFLRPLDFACVLPHQNRSPSVLSPQR